MSTSTGAVIDARPSFGGKSNAFLRIKGETLLERHVRLARSLGAERICIIESPAGAVSREALVLGAGVTFSTVDEKAPLKLSTAHVYKDAKAKIVWTLRDAHDIKNAEGELERAEFFTISKYTLRPLGRRLSLALYLRTSVTATHLTLARIAVGLAGALLFLKGAFAANMAASACVLFSWFLDLSDGQLARLRNEVSRFGAYLDSVGDGIVDNLYYVAISASLFTATRNPAWLLAGTAFLFAKYVFVNSTLLIPIVLERTPAGSVTASAPAPPASPARSLLKKIISILDDTDVRIHFLAAAAFLQVPKAALLFHVVYFNARWALNLTNAFFKYKIKKETK